MSEPNQPILEACEIYKTFYYPVRTPVLRGVNLTVSRGESLAITGRSGEGKSTLLQLLGTLESPCEGTLTIAGQVVSPKTHATIRSKHIAFIFQSFHLLEDYTALENVLMPARIARKGIVRGSEAYKHACALLDQVGLADRMHFQTKLLSGGEKQRVAIARALCNNPDLIFADEPSGNLDKQTASHIHELLLNLVRESKRSLILVTHDQDLAQQCDRRCTLLNGKLE
jgi:lipoprotein-releasing system ATP-binding protein